ncbi:putative P-loop containing nucleoside triphosphate hydrolase [Tanacetum coccineum]|uniref:P-loop containing nucleoside triphosphate hydrolase n=1 Tax=Tanacetum coccineum TaxID=301880 RepID=A0ABQ5HGN8_9ASTR
MSIAMKHLLSFNEGARNCDKCSNEGEKGVIGLNLRQAFNSFKLDTSQEDAVLSCLAGKNCCYQSSCMKLIWGPPGTGKTKTVASLLFILLRTKRRVLTCAPTNIAVVGVVKRLLSLLSDHDMGCDTYGYGDIVLFGNEERMKITDDHEELLDVFLDNRIDALSNCLSKWKTCVSDMIQFLENPMKEHRCFVVSTPKKSKSKRTKNKKKNEPTPDPNGDANQVTFEEFVLNKFNVSGKKLVLCIRSLYTHLPTSVIPLDFAKKMNYAIDLAHKVGESVKDIVARKQSLKEAFNPKVNRSHFVSLRLLKNECLITLKEIRGVSFIPKSMSQDKLYSFCLRSALLIFCTASSSMKLCRNGMTPIELVIIDEAAQLKECESVIPLQLPGVRNAVLVGDERQLPSMVQSKICEEAKFGRSLFERLVLLGHKKHLLNIQYRMHPTISQFPNTEFYNGQILDGPNVINRPCANHFLKDGMYGSYSFVNVDSAKEELDKNYSTRNMVEVAVIAELVANLYKESVAKKQTVTVGCISPYKAQVDAIQEKLGDRFNQNANGWSFSVNVRSVDGFQGSEEDVIIFSAVRCNSRGLIGFLSSHERANVALTRARHCLWIVGNKDTLIKSGSVWNTLVYDAENRGCVYNARDDKHLAQAMVHALVELADFGSLLKSDSILFKEAKWKVYFTKRFFDRIASITNLNVRKLLVTLLIKLASGWRQLEKNKQKNHNTRGLNNMLETNNVDGHLHLVWSIDIANENSLCFQVLKFWDILPLSQLQQSAKCLERAFGNYTLDTINRCLTKRLERNQVLPMYWPLDLDEDPTCALTSQLAKLSTLASSKYASIQAKAAPQYYIQTVI